MFDTWLILAAITNNGQLKRVLIIAESLAWFGTAFQTSLLLMALKRIKTIIEISKSLRQTYRAVELHVFLFISFQLIYFLVIVSQFYSTGFEIATMFVFFMFEFGVGFFFYFLFKKFNL